MTNNINCSENNTHTHTHSAYGTEVNVMTSGFIVYTSGHNFLMSSITHIELLL